jgi:3-oxoacid CoA-transferase subunit A
MLYTFVGDVHGKYSEFKRLLPKLSGSVIQLGDLGVGFTEESLPNTFKFIHGNHDNPEKCKNMEQFLGRFGMYNDMFYMSGADSIDKQYLVMGASWWHDEELSYGEMRQAEELYMANKPDVVFTHDCPASVYPFVVSHHTERNKTNLFLKRLLEIHTPKMWFFGHHHNTLSVRLNGCTFQCLSELDTYTFTH